MKRALELVMLLLVIVFVAVGAGVRMGVLERDEPERINCGPEGKRVPTLSGEWACIDRYPVFITEP